MLGHVFAGLIHILRSLRVRRSSDVMRWIRSIKNVQRNEIMQYCRQAMFLSLVS